MFFQIFPGEPLFRRNEIAGILTIVKNYANNSGYMYIKQNDINKYVDENRLRILSNKIEK